MAILFAFAAILSIIFHPASDRYTAMPVMTVVVQQLATPRSNNATRAAEHA